MGLLLLLLPVATVIIVNAPIYIIVLLLKFLYECLLFLAFLLWLVVVVFLDIVNAVVLPAVL